MSRVRRCRPDAPPPLYLERPPAWASRLAPAKSTAQVLDRSMPPRANMQTNATSRRLPLQWLRHVAVTLGVLCIAPALTACPKGDVGAPCNHGRINPPESKLVTFPALSCDELLCVYADEEEPPAFNCEPGPAGDATCNEADTTKTRFECVASADGTSGACRLRNQYVLERSMCSKKCSSDADCQSAGITQQVVVDDTACQSGFACARIQTLGEFCCEKLCVCKDDLNQTASDDIEMACSLGQQEGCCDQDPVPDACK